MDMNFSLAGRFTNRWLIYSLSLIGFITLILLTDLLLVQQGFISGHDWVDSFRPAALAIIDGESPYEVVPVYNPPWIFLPMIPLALLPEHLSVSLMFVMHFAGYGFAAYRMKTPVLNTVLFFTIPPIYFGAILGQIDWMVPLGAVMPPQFGLFLVLAKPQAGVGVAIFWLIEAFRCGGVKQVVKTFLPAGLAFGLSILIFGPYPVRTSELENVWWNLSFFPYAIPVGIGLLVAAIKNRDQLLSLSSGSFLSTYLSPQSLAIPVFGVIKNKAVLIGVVIGVWIMWMVYLK